MPRYTGCAPAFAAGLHRPFFGIRGRPHMIQFVAELVRTNSIQGRHRNVDRTSPWLLHAGQRSIGRVVVRALVGFQSPTFWWGFWFLSTIGAPPSDRDLFASAERSRRTLMRNRCISLSLFGAALVSFCSVAVAQICPVGYACYSNGTSGGITAVPMGTTGGAQGMLGGATGASVGTTVGTVSTVPRSPVTAPPAYGSTMPPATGGCPPGYTIYLGLCYREY
jgi:hypothetical protein